MKKICSIVLMIYLLFPSCQPAVIKMGEATRFHPDARQLKDGIVYKFYEHNIPANKNDAFSTNISYRTSQFFQPDLLVVKSFDAAMRLNWNLKYQVKDNRFKILDIHYSDLVDTVRAEITNDIMMDWTNNEASSDYKVPLKSGHQMLFSNSQTGLKDTIVDNRPCKIIESKGMYTIVSPSNDSTSYPSVSRNIYAKDLGLFERNFKTEKRTVHSELVEQMSLEEFEKRMKHRKRRIAYIDPNQTLDDHSDFKICNEEISIKDYYNCNNHAQIQGGKGTWRRILKRDLDSKKLKNESGYLTFRFVINCNGEVGRFITEEADLDFNKKKFDKELVTHLFEIVSPQKNWRACNEKGLSHDAYTYVTFKLKDGNIIEILP